MSGGLVYLMIYISAFVPIIPFGIGLLRFSTLGRDRRILTGLTAFSLFIQVVALMFMLNSIPNNFFFHIYTPIEFILLSIIYKDWLKAWWNKHVFSALMIGFTGFCFFNTIFFQAYDTMNSHAVLLGSFVLLVYAIAYFYRVISELSLGPLESSYQFWINTSILLYYSGSLLILGLTPFIFSQKYAGLIWIFHSIFNILHYLLFGVGLWIKPQATNFKS